MKEDDSIPYINNTVISYCKLRSVPTMTELQVVALVAMQEGRRDVGWLLYCIIEHLVM